MRLDRTNEAQQLVTKAPVPCLPVPVFGCRRSEVSEDEKTDSRRQIAAVFFHSDRSAKLVDGQTLTPTDFGKRFPNNRFEANGGPSASDNDVPID